MNNFTCGLNSFIRSQNTCLVEREDLFKFSNSVQGEKDI